MSENAPGTRSLSRGTCAVARRVLSAAAEDLRRTARGSKCADELAREAALLEDHGTRMSPAAYDPLAAKAVAYSAREARRRRRKP